jgi:hypothetical protein
MVMKNLILICSLLASTLVNARIIQVKQGEYLSTIAAKYFLDKPYGKEGGITHIKMLNPQLKGSDEVVPGEFLALEKSSVATLQSKYLLETKNGVTRYFKKKPKPKKKPRKPYPIFGKLNPYEREKNEFFFAPVIGSLRMVAKEGPAVEDVKSDMGKGFQFGYMKNWTHGLSTYLKYGMLTYSFETSGNQTLVNKTRTSGFFEAGVDLRYAERHGIEINAGMRDMLIFQSINIASPEIKKVTTPFTTITSKHHFVKTKGASLGPELVYMATLNGRGEGIKSNNSHFYGANFHLDTRTHWGRFVTNLRYIEGELATSFSKQEIISFGAEINFHINF